MQLKTKLTLLVFLCAFYLKTEAQTGGSKIKTITLKANESINLDRLDTVFNKSFSDNSNHIQVENPFLNCSSDKKIDINAWSAKTSKRLKKSITSKRKANRGGANTITTKEQESFFERVNGESTPQALTGLGNSQGLKQNILVKGAFNSSIANAQNFPVTTLEITEGTTGDNGSIDLAQRISLTDASIDNFRGSGFVGDGIHSSSGTGSGDHDYYTLDLEEGDLLRIAVNSTDPDNIIFPNIRVFRIRETFDFLSGFTGDAIFVAGNARAFFAFDGTTLTNLRPRRENGEVIYLVERSAKYAVEIADSLQEDIQFTSTVDLDNSSVKITITEREDEFVSGDEFGFGNEGAYDMEINVFKTSSQDQDFYTVELNKGDVLGASLDLEDIDVGSEFLAANGIDVIGDGISVSKRFGFGITNPSGTLQVLTNTITSLLPINSPLPEVGEASFSYIAPESGTYQLALAGNVGAYDLRVTTTDPGLELNKGQKQFIYLDFTGVDNITLRTILGKRNAEAIVARQIPEEITALNKERSLSSFENFLENWGVEKNRTNKTKLAREITQVVAENLRADLIESQINPNLDVVIISDYGSDFLGKKIPELLEKFKVPYSRVIVGGTIEEAGIETIGIASTIDPGNYSLNDNAVVLLDFLSAEATNPNSINSVSLAEGFTIEDLLPVALGNIISHEAGHFLGNFHTSNENDTFSIMDIGGSLENSFGISPTTGVFGEDTVDVDFKLDNYAENEFPLSVAQNENHTDVNTAFALSFVPKYNYYSKQAKQSNDEVFTEELIRQIEQSVLENLDATIVNSDATVYPNPISLQNTNEVSVSFNAANNGIYKVELYNLGGQKVATIFEDSVSNASRKVVNFSPQQQYLVSGVYICKITTPENEISKKIIVN
ncbi:T9SS type A sorting domain-containing protein [uncultured Algibacter sp.]|uniref:T9SS type A sorting domain-containing protein n=1 Tax=uncultured Algibacter sp. TaxID=298659 RepID=UPI00321698F1